MAISINELQVHTEVAAAAPSAAMAAKPKPAPARPNFRAEMEKLRERELRLLAD